MNLLWQAGVPLKNSYQMTVLLKALMVGSESCRHGPSARVRGSCGHDRMATRSLCL